MKNVNPFEIVVVKVVDELGFGYRVNVWLTDLPKMVRGLVVRSGSTPLESFEVLFGLDPVKNADGLVEIWSGFPR